MSKDKDKSISIISKRKLDLRIKKIPKKVAINFIRTYGEHSHYRLYVRYFLVMNFLQKTIWKLAKCVFFQK